MEVDLNMELDPNMESDLEWWLSNSSQHSGKPLQIRQWDLMTESKRAREPVAKY